MKVVKWLLGLMRFFYGTFIGVRIWCFHEYSVFESKFFHIWQFDFCFQCFFLGSVKMLYLCSNCAYFQLRKSQKR